MTVSLWQRLDPKPERLQADVAIIGAGISGLSAAIECEARGVSAVILEQDFPGAKASGRNAGFLMRGAADNYAVACDQLGRDYARLLWKWTEDNLHALRAFGITALPGFREQPSCLAALDQHEADDLDRSLTLMKEDGFRAELIHPGPRAPDDPIWRSGRPLVGLVNPDDAVCSPVELVGMLRGALRTTGLRSASRVYAMEPDGKGVTVRARGCEVRAGRVLVCTNAYACGLLPELEGVVVPNRGQMLALRPEQPADADLAFAYYLNCGSEYLRSGPDRTVIVGGARKHRADEEQTDAEGLNPRVQDRLEEWARDLITERFEVIARWSGIMGFSPDGMPVVRACAGFQDRVWFCGGLTGHGMSMGHLTARHAVRVMFEGCASPFGLDPDCSRPGV